MVPVRAGISYLIKGDGTLFDNVLLRNAVTDIRSFSFVTKVKVLGIVYPTSRSQSCVAMP